MTLDVLEDRLDLLREIAAIEHDLTAIEQRYGSHAAGEDVRRRLLAVRLVVLDQVRGAMTAPSTSIH